MGNGICTKIYIGLALFYQPSILAMQDASSDLVVIDQTDQYIIFRHTYNQNEVDIIIIYFSEFRLAEEFHELDVTQCACNICYRRQEKKDRFHVIPPILQKILPHAYRVTRKKMNKQDGFYNNLIPKIDLHDGSFALVLEARIINAKKINQVQISLQDFIQQSSQRKMGHYWGAYVFIYNDSKHCVHAMFHKKPLLKANKKEG